MAVARDIKRRITSVKNTAQITRAMQMVSASKMQKAQDRAFKAIPYAEGIYEVVNKISDTGGYDSPYLTKRSEIKNIAIVVIGTSRGFVGSLLAALTNSAYDLAKNLKNKYPEVNIKGISVHKTGQKILHNAGIENDFHFSKYIEAPNTTDLTAIFSLLVDKFQKGEYDEIHLVYSHFVNTIVQKPATKKILPLSLEDIAQEAKEFEAKNEQKHAHKAYVFEPTAAAVLDRLLPEYFQTQIYTGLLESIASEHSARMVAMKNATDNSKELQKALTLKYNRTRQAGITQEIIEIISGTVA